MFKYKDLRMVVISIILVVLCVFSGVHFRYDRMKLIVVLLLVLSVIPLIREVRRSIPRSGACEKSASTKSQLSKATEEKRQSLKLPFLNRQCAKRTWFILLIARLMYPALHSCSRI